MLQMNKRTDRRTWILPTPTDIVEVGNNSNNNNNNNNFTFLLIVFSVLISALSE